MNVQQQSRRRSGEEGMALVLALLVLLSLTFLGSALMLSVNTEGKIAGHQLRDTQALSIAEAGLQEAILHLRTGAVPDNLDPSMVTLIYEAPAGSIPISGADTVSLPTLQAPGSYLGYSSPNKEFVQGNNTDLQVLSVKYKTIIVPGAPPDTLIMRYDDGANPKLNTVTGSPVFTIVSTGRKGNASRGIVADVTTKPFNMLVRSAVAAEVAIQFKGNIKICGHDHRGDTPINTQPPGCNLGVGTWWTAGVHGDCLPGGWSESIITEQGASVVIGEPTAKQENQTGFYSGPWEAMGLPQTEFWTWVGTPVSSITGDPQGIYYLDNNSTLQDQSGNWVFTGGNGEGLLYADGDLRLNGNFTFKGLIYVEGDLKVNGTLWILGGVIVRGKTVVKVANGSAVILYSSEALQQNISKYGGDIRTIAWREY